MCCWLFDLIRMTSHLDFGNAVFTVGEEVGESGKGKNVLEEIDRAGDVSMAKTSHGSPP